MEQRDYRAEGFGVEDCYEDAYKLPHHGLEPAAIQSLRTCIDACAEHSGPSEHRKYCHGVLDALLDCIKRQSGRLTAAEKVLIQIRSIQPWREDDFGHLSCVFCGNDKAPHHENHCAVSIAYKLQELQHDKIR